MRSLWKQRRVDSGGNLEDALCLSSPSVGERKVNFSRIMSGLADTFGDHEAVVNLERRRRLTFREYHRITNQIAHILQGPLGLGKGDRYVCILNNDNLALFHWGMAAKSTSTCCHANYRDSLETHLYQIDLVKPKVVFLEHELMSTHVSPLLERGIRIVVMDGCEESTPGVDVFSDLLTKAPTNNTDIEIDDRSHIILMRFTGGTTGNSKCAKYSLDNILACRDSFLELPDGDFHEGCRMLHIAPISHGSGMTVLPTLFSGGCTVTMNEPSLENWCRYVQEERITHAFLVPTIAYRLLEMQEANKFDLSSLQTVLYGAAPMSPSKAKALVERFGSIFVQVYGSTEHLAATLTLGKNDHLIDQSTEGKLASAGRRVTGAEVSICDNEGNPVPVGELGEFYLRSRATCLGYEGNPEKTEEEFTQGYWKSGDIGYADADGYLFLVDRKKDMIITGGFNVYATEVEAAINSHPSVLMSAVVGIPHEDWGEAVHAEIVLNGSSEVCEDDLVAHIRSQIGSFKTPKTFKVVDQLPTSAVGKVLRKDVRAKYWKSHNRRIA
ncbi:class I adenylate-forming enzyme family protein [Hyphomonas sp. ND6WE1B]|uniref:class I adenylate-forming enzyme family protein n=1 Tax=Hyphomonas sp. ND6WE1B TaxID=1848191 RepID=UPI0011122485|nr:AMP-binding protein [Hyphomonas sp. ND6WE1B]